MYFRLKKVKIRITKEVFIKMNVANVITFLRIIGTLFLMLTVPFSKRFFVLYTFTGITDALDGFAARKFKCATEFGAKLDSAADLLFYSVMIFKIMPELYIILPHWIWYMVVLVVVIRVISYIVTAVKTHRFMSNHTYLNKLTGFCVFIIPYVVNLSDLDVVFCATSCVIAIVAAVQELAYSLNLRRIA